MRPGSALMTTPSGERYRRVSSPPGQMEKQVTLHHILFPYDFSTDAHRIAPHVRALALRTGARVTLLRVHRKID